MHDEFCPNCLEAEFTRAFRASLDPRLYMEKLVPEELDEVQEAALSGDQAAYLKEVADLMYVLTGWDNRTEYEHTMVSEEEAGEWLRLVQDVQAEITLAMEVFTPSQVQEAFRRVHASNMSKLGVDGKPIVREDGKVLKGPNYQEPDLADLVS